MVPLPIAKGLRKPTKNKMKNICFLKLLLKFLTPIAMTQHNPTSTVDERSAYKNAGLCPVMGFKILRTGSFLYRTR